MQPHPLFSFISTAIFCLSEMEIVDLSKLRLCLVISTSTGLNEAKKEEFMLPPIFSTEKSSKEPISALHHDPSFELCSYQLLNLAIFLKLSNFLTWLLWTLLSGDGEIWSYPCECFSLTTEENPPRLTTGQHWIGIHVFAASQERGYLMIHLVSKYISTGSQVSCRW